VAHKAAIGAAAGVLPGLLGIGTGGILVPAFTWLSRAPVKIAMAASLACFSFNALVSAAFKLQQGHVDTEVALPLCIGTLAGGAVGAALNSRLRSRVVSALFGAFFTYVAVKFVFSAFEVSV
jgi:uncharacterized membrane protein YfcA